MTTPEIKPCPFCPVVHDYPYADYSQHMGYYVTCADCGCLQLGRTQDEAIANWNTRAGDGGGESR